MLIIQGVRSCRKLTLSSMYGKFNNKEELTMSRRLTTNKEGKIIEVKENTLSQLALLQQRKREVLRMIHNEGNNITRGIYKTQLLHIDIAIDNLEKAQ